MPTWSRPRPGSSPSTGCPSESPHDSPWILGDEAKTVFLGDQIYDHKHCYLADGFYEDWRRNIETLRMRFPDGAVFYIGHGGPVGGEMSTDARSVLSSPAAQVHP